MVNYRYFIICLFTLLSLYSYSQKVVMGPGAPIPDFPKDTCFKLNLAEVFPATLDTVFGLEKFCLNIIHPDPKELDIYLVSPDGTSVEISTDNGNGEDMIATCFSMTSTIPVSAVANFNEVEAIPEANLGELNNGQTSVGLWELCITDDTPNNAGELVSWELHLGYNPPPPEAATISPVCNTSVTIGCVCPDGGDNCFLLPDIIVADKIINSKEMYTEFPGKLTVTTATSNIGYGPLEFRGTGKWFCNGEPAEPGEYCPNSYEYPEQLVVQRIYRRFPDKNTGFVDIEAGTMKHHAQEGHDHPHIDNWAFNTLRTKGIDPDPTNWPIVGEGTKVSFCAENTIACYDFNFFCEYDSVALDINKMPNARMGQVYECNATVQGVSVGYSDVYGQILEGQQIFFSPNTCNGKYYIVTEFDPDSIFQELNETNNIAVAEIQLKEQSGDCCSVDFAKKQLEMNGSFIQFIDRSMPTPDKWIWEFGDGKASSEQFPIHQYEQPGIYSVTLSTENNLGCTDFKTIEVMVDSLMVGIADDLFTQYQYRSSIVPNPMQQTAIFDYHINKSGFIQIDVLDATGRLIKNLQPLQKQISGTHQLLVSDLSKGIYLIKTKLNGSALFKKLVVL